MLSSTILRRTLPLACLVSFAACSGDDDDGNTPIPTVRETRPASGATNVAFDTSIEITFSEAMDPTAGTVTLEPGGRITGTWNTGNTVLTAQPPTDLVSDTQYTVRLAGFTSAAGGALAATSFSFTTAAEADEDDPRILSTMPSDDATDVPLNLASVRVTFNEAMDTSNGSASIDGNATIGAPSWSSDDTIVTFVVSGLEATTDYAIRFSGFTDVAGNGLDDAALGDGVLGFTTAAGGDTEAPTVTASSPTEGAADVPAGDTDITITFSEAMDDAVGAVTVNGAAATATWNGDDTQISVRATLVAGVTYAVEFAGFTDIAGNALDTTPYLMNDVLDFTVAEDMGAPNVARSSPSEGTPNVPVALTSIEIEFDEAMTTTATAGALEDTSTQTTYPLTGVWTDAQTLEFDITGLLALGRDYRVDVRPYADLAGNPVAATALGDGYLDFSTPPDTVAPTVVSSNPAEGATNVAPAIGGIVVTFSEAIDPTTAAAALSDGASSNVITPAVSADGITATYAVALNTGTTYTLDLTGVMDLAGNALDGVTYLGDGLLDFSLPAPPTGFDCASPLTIGYATSVVGNTYRFDLQGGATGGNGSLLCDDSDDGDDMVIEYVKQSDTLANGGMLLHASAVSANTTGFNLEVLSGSCTFGTTSTQHHCYWNNTDIDTYLDVPAGTYWIWVSRNTSGAFQGGTIEIEEVPPTAAEGEGCWLPWTTNSAIYTAPATANDPHVWNIPATAINSFDMDVTWGGVGSISCDNHPTYGDIHGADTVIEYARTSTNAIITVDVTGIADTVNAEILDRCVSADPARVSYACQANFDTGSLIVGPGVGNIYIWISTEATGDHFPGATVEVREVVPQLGESCASAHPVGAGSTSLTTMSTARLGVPLCMATTGAVEWYRYTVMNGRVQINANAGAELGVIDANGSTELGCSATPNTLGVGRALPVGSEVCIAVPVGATNLTIVDTPDVYTGVGTNTATIAVTPVAAWNTDYWMTASPNWIYFGRSGGDVQRWPNPVTSPVQSVEVFAGSTNVGYAAVSLADDQLFSLDNASSATNPRLFRLWDGVAATFTAEPWDLTPAYPVQDARGLAFDGTNLIYATHATNNTDVFSVPVGSAQSPTPLGSNDLIDNVTGIAADGTYVYFTAQSVAGNVDGVYRIARTDLSNPATVPELVLQIDIGTLGSPIYLDDPVAPQYLYVRQGNPADIHVVELPGSSAPIYRGVIADLGGSADYAWTYDASTNSIFLFETESVTAGQIVRVF